MMLLDGLRHAVTKYPGGRPAIAARLGKSDEVLRKELAGTSPQHKLGLTDAQHIIEMCGEQGVDTASFRVAVDAACLVTTKPVPEKGVCLQTLSAQSTSSVAQVGLAVAMALADLNYSCNDRKQVDAGIQEAIGLLTQVLAASKARHGADKRRHQHQHP